MARLLPRTLAQHGYTGRLTHRLHFLDLLILLFHANKDKETAVLFGMVIAK